MNSAAIIPERRFSTWTALQLVGGFGRALATYMTLFMASMTVALEVSYRIMIAFTKWRTFVVSKEVTIALFLVLFFAFFFGLLALATCYVANLLDGMNRRCLTLTHPPESDSSS